MFRPVLAAVLGVLLLVACMPSLPLVDAGRSSDQTFDALVDPQAQTVTVTPRGWQTQATGVFVRSANAVWQAPVFSFDLLVTNRSGSSLSAVAGVVLSTTPAAPAVTSVGTSGTDADGLPFYSYGSIADTATATTNWKFAVPGAIPFRFGFTVRAGANGQDTGPVKNKSPQLSGIQVSPVQVLAGGTATLTASAADPDGDPLNASWSATSGAVAGTGLTTTYTAPAAPGLYSVTVVVDDGKGGTDTLTGPVAVVNGAGSGLVAGLLSFGNSPAPDVKTAVITPSPVTINPGDPCVLSVAGYDSAHLPVASHWYWTQTGSTYANWHGTLGYPNTDQTVTWISKNGATQAGTAVVTVRADNGRTASTTVTVNEVPPTITSQTPATGVSVAQHTPVTFTVAFQDGNGNDTAAPSVVLTPNTAHLGLNASWAGPTAQGVRTVTVSTPGFTAPGSHTLMVSQTDGTTTTPCSWTITVL